MNGEEQVAGIDYREVAPQKLMIMNEHIASLLADDIPLSEEHQSMLASLSAEVQEAIRVHLRARGIEPAGFRGGGDSAESPV